MNSTFGKTGLLALTGLSRVVSRGERLALGCIVTALTSAGLVGVSLIV